MTSIDAFVRSLTSPVSVPVRVRVGVFGRRGRIMGLSVRQILDVAARHPGSRDFLWSIFGLGRRPDVEVSTADAATLFDVLQTALGSRGIATVWRLTHLPAPVFDAVLRTVVEATMPDPEAVDELFEPAAGREGEDSNDDHGGPWRDPAVVLTNVVIALEERGFVDPSSWTPGRLLYTASRLAERDAERAKRSLVDGAVSARLGQADQKSWKRAMAEIGGSR